MHAVLFTCHCPLDKVLQIYSSHILKLFQMWIRVRLTCKKTVVGSMFLTTQVLSLSSPTNRSLYSLYRAKLVSKTNQFNSTLHIQEVQSLLRFPGVQFLLTVDFGLVLQACVHAEILTEHTILRLQFWICLGKDALEHPYNCYVATVLV